MKKSTVMAILRYIFVIFSLFNILYAECELPNGLQHFSKKVSINEVKAYGDIRRNIERLNHVCIYKVVFEEEKYPWEMLLITHPQHVKGAFWFLPHDDENTAFDAAVYAVNKYGGGFLAVMADNKRYFKGQDPNRNFGDTKQTAKTCKQQHYPAPKYSSTVFTIIDKLKKDGYPYLALHNNKNGWYGNGGEGSISMLTSSSIVRSYKVPKDNNEHSRMNDEDNLIYIAGKNKNPDKNKLDRLLQLGFNVKYEIVSEKNNDCSLSNYIILNKETDSYYNIEAEHNDLETHKIMIDRFFQVLQN